MFKHSSNLTNPGIGIHFSGWHVSKNILKGIYDEYQKKRFLAYGVTESEKRTWITRIRFSKVHILEHHF